MSDEEFAHEGFLVSADPQEHIDRVQQMIDVDDAITAICLQSIGDLDPLTSIRRYGDEVLPALRREAGGSAKRFERESDTLQARQT